ncbi:MAG: polyprenyl diphosphate synthase [Bacteroidales bacterium]|nr:di-trans,poly-cis-decaprenylcistransferase [Candidatus Cryptobacteroides onthequi]MCQ2164541.1 polyprenyl diphosphate synthase [Bacteroidales bacterium]
MTTDKNIPVHVSIIMDGNGRWARERGQERVMGHIAGVKSVRACAEESVRQGVKYLSLFAFSEENWGRPQAEVDALMKLMMKSLSDEVGTLMDNGVRFVVLGNRKRLSETLDSAITQLEKMTEGNQAMTLIVFLSYSGKWDILQAARRMAEEIAADPGKVVSPEDFDSYLVTAGIPDPDLIIRTSGEQRISNYLLWQGAYSEFLFTDVLWPDFHEEQYRAALDEYAKRDRRYGKVK